MASRRRLLLLLLLGFCVGSVLWSLVLLLLLLALPVLHCIVCSCLCC
jgi:hypothetical protein